MTTRAPKTDLLMIKDAAEYLKVTEITINRLAAAKKMQAFKVAGNWRFSRADIDARIIAQTAAPLAAAMDSERPTGRAP